MTKFKLKYPIKKIENSLEVDEVELDTIKIPERFKAGDLVGTHDHDPVISDLKLISKVARVSLDLVKRIDLEDLRIIQEDMQKKLNLSPGTGKPF